MRKTKNNIEIVATLKGIEILAAPHLKPNILRGIRRGSYERPEIEFGLANLRSGDRVLEMGTGAGIVSSIFAKNVKDLTLRSFEANPDLIDHIRKLYIHNQVDHSVSVQNNIVVSGKNRPDSIDFFVRSNFLGSRMSQEDNEPESRKVSIPTKHYDEITDEYPHNVLVMDIEGAELEFLEDADLSNIELVMLELHPKIYKESGRRKIIEYLTRRGFILDEATSRGQVASFKTPDRMKLTPDFSQIRSAIAPNKTYDLDPKKSLAEQIITVGNAVLAKTPQSQGWRISASVFDADRNIVPKAICWLTHKQSATKDRPHPRQNRIVDLPGTWLFGGRFYPHFGHFLMETLSRLWALDHLGRPIDGVLFFPAFRDFEAPSSHLFSELSTILDISVPYKIVDEFYKVDHLIVPPQGSGIGQLMLSSPDMRNFIAKHLRRDLPALPPHKLYISRSGSFGKIGRGFVGEKHLETLLQNEGYEIFHPQDHSWAVQLQHYLSATHILGPDGSPFHLVNFTGRKDLKLGILQRRLGHETQQMIHQAQLYGIPDASLLSFTGRYWACAGHQRAAHSLISELRFGPLCDELKSRGFISSKANWQNLTDSELEEELQAQANEAGNDMRRVRGNNDDMSQFPTAGPDGKPRVFMTN